ncbi:gliding motility protein [Streptomyces sp. NPDC086989]|uniref:gliding motility protein n=1 Tax=Streptomyces sp. NPDC086989 TaxID=3365764 RepID=UPI0038202E5F
MTAESEAAVTRTGAEGEPAAEAPAAEAVEIPKQQSAEAAADSETGESART